MAAIAADELEPPARPNFVVVNVDDMRADELWVMQHTLELLGDGGTTFENAFVPTALSGPSRASLLTGLYAHNTGVLNNLAPLGGEVNFAANRTLPMWLQESGYRTGHFGKNEEFGVLLPSQINSIPQGWDQYVATRGYYRFELNVNGQISEAQETEYSIDALAMNAVDFVLSNDFTNDPLLIYYAPMGAHAPFTPALRHEGAFDQLLPHRPPSYNIVPPDNLARNSMTGAQMAQMDANRINHLETLLSVDEAVRDIYVALETVGQANNTVFIFTGDNGLLFGEHALADKNNFYEEAIRVPLIIKDARNPKTQSAAAIALNIDIAATVASIAGVSPPNRLDGKSLEPIVADASIKIRNSFLVEDWYHTNAVQRRESKGYYGMGVRTQVWKYVEYENGKPELYHLLRDPYELQNRVNDFPDVVSWLRARMEALRDRDRTGPVVTSLQTMLSLADSVPQLSITGRVSDRQLGGNRIATPEYFIDIPGTTASGLPMDTSDGRFDTVDERINIVLPAAQLSELTPGSHQIHVRPRDAAGNFGQLQAATFDIGPAVRMISESDTGDSDTDGVTIDTTPTFTGSAPAGTSVRVFDTTSLTQTRELGTAIADVNGVWSLTAQLFLGSHRVFAWHTIDGNIGVLSAGAAVHLVASTNSAKQVTVRGSSNSDRLTIETIGNLTAIYVNSILAGSFVNARSVNADGREGDDSITYHGLLPSTLIGGPGNDTLQGGDGPDRLDGGRDNNVMKGGGGNDRYIISGFAVSAKQRNVDKVWELAEEGYDLLDFSKAQQKIAVNAATSTIAILQAGGSYGVRIVGIGDGISNSFEEFAGGANDDRFANLLDTHKVTVSPGNDVATLASPLNAGESIAINAFAFPPPSVDAIVRIRLTAEMGVLRVNTTVEGGISETEVTGNGTGTVEILALQSAIDKTLRALEGLVFDADLLASGPAVLAMHQLDEADNLLNSEELRVTINGMLEGE